MFTGIIEEIGQIVSIKRGTVSALLTIQASVVLEGTKVGDSIAVNGICFTVTGMTDNTFTADVMAETLRKSSLGELSSGAYVNLERAMAADGRFGGHIVSGHIDGTGEIVSTKREENAVWIEIKTPPDLLRYIVKEGSIAIDGISLTVAKLMESSFLVSLIPHTGGQTTLLQKKQGEHVNLENDIVGKYVERFLSAPAPDAGKQESRRMELSFLAEHGFL